jgi:hypothetical protein
MNIAPIPVLIFVVWKFYVLVQSFPDLPPRNWLLEAAACALLLAPLVSLCWLRVIVSDDKIETNN